MNLATQTPPAKGWPYLGIDTRPINAARKPSTGAASRDLPVSGKSFRYDLQRVSQSLLYNPAVMAGEQRRIVWCSRTFKGDRATVHRTLDGGNSRISGVQVCGDVWTCPVCSARVTEERRQELVRAMETHIKNGGYSYLLTLTFPHNRDQPLDELLEKQGRALTMLKNSRTYKRIMGESKKPGSAERIGSVKSLEVTHGENGWHPHTHDLVFAKAGAFGESQPDAAGRLSSPAIDELRKQWILSCAKAGLCTREQLQDMVSYSLDVRGGQYAAEYIAKFGREAGTWGMAEELTKSHSKTGKRGGHYTPFQLLVLYRAGEAWAGELFREFAAAFRGKRMMTWSPKLRKSLSLGDELSDQELAENAPPEEQQVGHVTTEQFKVLLSRNSMGQFLEYVATMCCIPETAQQDIDDFINDLQRRQAKYGDVMRQRNMMSGRGYSILDGAAA